MDVIFAQKKGVFDQGASFCALILIYARSLTQAARRAKNDAIRKATSDE
jgi:hypothetical protein